MEISTSIKLLLLSSALILTFSPATSSHEGRIVSDTGFDLPDLDTHAEIATRFAAPFVFLTLLLQATLRTMFNTTLADKGEDYGTMSTIMALSIVGMLVPSPFWNYIIFASETIGILAVTTLVVMLLLILYWVATSSNSSRWRY